MLGFLMNNRIAQGVGGALLAFVGWTAWLATRDARIRRERDREWENKILKENKKTEDAIDEAVDNLEDELFGSDGDGLRVVTERDPYNTGAVQLEPEAD